MNPLTTAISGGLSHACSAARRARRRSSGGVHGFSSSAPSTRSLRLGLYGSGGSSEALERLVLTEQLDALEEPR
jgi:hypothetical protein